MGPEGVDHVNAFPDAITTILKETSLAGAKDLYRRLGIDR